MREYTVIKEILNIRSKPSDESDNTYVGYLLQGDTVWLDEKEVPGTIPKGGTTDVWLTYNGNNVVAKDGVRPRSYEDKVTEFVRDDNFTYLHNKSPNADDWKVSWGYVDLEIWKIWRDYNAKGKGVKVAIIDDGCWSLGNDLEGRLSVQSTSVVDDGIDANNPVHGTHSAGIIGANGKHSVYGIAPECELIVIKAGNDSSFEGDDIIKSVEHAYNLGVDIINLSLKTNDDEILKGWISKCVSKPTKPILVFAAAGNDGTSDKFYPASYDDVVSIGAYYVNEDGIRKIYKEHSNHNNMVKLIMPGKKLLSTGKDKNKSYHEDTSAASAFTAGVFALLLSILEDKAMSYSFVIDVLSKGNVCESIEGIKDYEGFGVLSITSLINNIKNKTTL